MEALRAELALAKEQARVSNAAALKAAEELRAEQAARRRSEEKIAEMVVEQKNVADRYELLGKDNKANAADLKRPLMQQRRRVPRLGMRGRSFDKMEKSRLEAPICSG